MASAVSLASPAGVPASESPTAIAMALVAEAFRKTELVRSAATGVPAMRAYRPVMGLTPARMADAIASGMLAMPVVRPAMTSRRRPDRSSGCRFGTVTVLMMALPRGRRSACEDQPVTRL